MEIALLAVTRLSDGVCLAGVNRAGAWIRPTRPANLEDTWRQLEKEDCCDRQGNWVACKGNVVDVDLARAIPKGYHSEDWLVGERPIKLVRELPEDAHMKVCSRFSEGNLRRLFVRRAPRSLILIEPDEIVSFDFGFELSRRGDTRYLPRLSFEHQCQKYADVAVTDAEWRGLGRQLMREYRGDCHFAGRELLDRFGIRRRWLSVGRYDGDDKPYLLVIGVHLFPVQRFAMDFER